MVCVAAFVCVGMSVFSLLSFTTPHHGESHSRKPQQMQTSNISVQMEEEREGRAFHGEQRVGQKGENLLFHDVKPSL